MVKRIISVVVALAVAFAIIMVFESISGSLFTTPGLDPRNPKTLSDMMAAMPLGAFLWLLLGYAVSAFVGGVVATFISGRDNMRAALIVGSVLTAGSIMNLIEIPHPMWFAVINVLMCVPFAWLGYLTIRKTTKPTLKTADDI